MNILLQQHGTNCCNNRLKELKHLEYIIATLGVKHMKQRSNKNTCNNMEQLLQHEIEATETFQKYYCNICAKHMKHLDQNDCNIRIETSETF